MNNQFDYKNINKKWKWVLDVPYARKWRFSTSKPKRIRGGYQLPNGSRYIGQGVRLLTRQQYIDECREVEYNNARRVREGIPLTLGASLIEVTYLKWRELCDYVLH